MLNHHCPASEATFLRLNNNNDNFSSDDVLYFVLENIKKFRHLVGSSEYVHKFRF
jgi:hypothetical protein